MKKMIISISTIFAAVLSALVVVFIITNRKKEISITSKDGSVTIELGTFQAYDYESNYEWGCAPIISFKTKDSKEAYDTIRENKLYKRDLDFDVEDQDTNGHFDVYGFYVVDNHIFQYTIQTDLVIFRELCEEYIGKNLEFNGILIGPFGKVTYDRLIPDSKEYNESMGYYAKVNRTGFTYDMLKALVSYCNPEYMKETEEGILFKAISSDSYFISNKSNQELKWTEDYVVVVYLEDNGMRIKNYAN